MMANIERSQTSGEPSTRGSSPARAASAPGKQQPMPLSTSEVGHNIEPPEWVPHGTGRCTCTVEGEDLHCPHHGYEAVIARLHHELAGAVEALQRLVAWWDENSDLPDEVAFARTVLADLNQPGGR